MSQGKVKSLAMLFNSYPALTWSVEATKAKVETYLTVLQEFSEDQVQAACAVFMKRNSPFPPSTGELAHECRNAVVHVADQAKLARFRSQGEPLSDMPEEERAAMRARVAKLFADFKMGLPKDEEKPWSGKSVWKPGPIGSLIAADLIALMPDQPPPDQEVAPVSPSQTEGGAAIPEDDDAPQF